VGVVAGVLLGGERVEVAADRVELLGDLLRGTPPRALEQQVLEVVRGACLRRRLVARADVHPDPSETERTPDTVSVSTRSPPGSTVRETPPGVAGTVRSLEPATPGVMTSVKRP
jgi:hypothetical protein